MAGEPTTHWRYVESIAARFPRIRLEPDMLYVDQRDVLTAAGSAAGIDLCLHVVRKDFGPEAANSVARRLVVPPHREGGQAQFIQRPVARERDNARLGPMIDWLRERLDQTHSIKHLSAHAGMSLRTFQRRFEQVTGLPPGEWLIAERIRLAQERRRRGRDAGRYRCQMRLRLGGNHAASLQAPGRYHARDLPQEVFPGRTSACDITAIPRDRAEVNDTWRLILTSRPTRGRHP